MRLSRYIAKRDFSRTREPKGKVSRRSSGSRYVIQKHAASRLHYDFRLEIDGVLKSWAVPKGIPMVQGEKRLAVQVEDHPVAYGSFEGIIPAGNYGAGTVMLWDKGRFDVADNEPAAGLSEGKLSLRLEGAKLNGHWSLVKLRGTDKESQNAWLLIKTNESMPAISARADDRSVSSRRTMKQIALHPNALWQATKTSSSERAKWPAKKQGTLKKG